MSRGQLVPSALRLSALAPLTARSALRGRLNQKGEPPAAPAAQDGIVSAPPADPFVPQIQERGSASGLKTWRSI
jgi:hypothetical protein